ncbi:hypothetical protein DFH06DRAFT_1137564 [Mycena polygramma]|nr:hypothetical protein DFH06DRAFT_1137564 [Mycena polygramma]
MAPTSSTAVSLPTVLPFTRLFHFPTISPAPLLTPSAAPLRGSASSSTALYILLITVIVFALLETVAIVWLCFRPRAPLLPASERDAEKAEPGLAARLKIIPESHPDASDGSRIFNVKQTVPNCLITTPKPKMNEAQRILGRPEVVTEDSQDDEAIPDRSRKAF